MAKYKGRDFLLKMGAVASTPTTIAGMRSHSISLSKETVDTTNKDSAGIRELLAGAGTRSISMNASGFASDDASLETLRGYAFGDTAETFSLFFPNGDTLEGSFEISGWEQSGEHAGALECSFTLESAGAWTYTVAP